MLGKTQNGFFWRNPYFAGFHCENGEMVYFTFHFHISWPNVCHFPFLCQNAPFWKQFILLVMKPVQTWLPAGSGQVLSHQWAWLEGLSRCQRPHSATVSPGSRSNPSALHTRSNNQTFVKKWEGSPATSPSVKRDFVWKHSLPPRQPDFYKTCLPSSPPFPEPVKDVAMESNFKSNLVNLSMLVLLPRRGGMDYTLVTFLTKRRVI